MALFIARISATGPSPANWKTRNSLLLAVLLLISLGARAAPVLEVGSELQRLDLGHAVDILADPDRNYRIEDLRRSPLRDRFRPISPGDLNLDFRHADYWLRFSLRNTSPQQQTPTLKILPPYIEHAEMFIDHSAEASPPLRAVGLLSPPLLFDLPLPANGTRSFILHLSDSRRLPVTLDLFYWPQLLSDYRDTLYFNGITTGALLTLFIFNLVAGISARRSTSLWLSSYCLFVLMAMVAGWHLFTTGQPNDQLSNPLFNALVLASLAVSIQFSLAFGIAPSNSAPLANILLRSLTALVTVSIFLSLVLDPQRSQYLLFLWLPLAALGLVLQPLLAFMASGDRLVLYYFFTRLWVIVFDCFGLVAFDNEWGNVETINAVLIASTSLEALTLTGLLVMRSRQQQQRQRQVQQYLAVAEAESRTHSELLSHLANRLRSPMSVLMGNIEMLRHGHLTAKQRDYVDTAQQACQNLLHEFDATAAQTMRHRGVTQLAQTMMDVRKLVEDCRKDFDLISSQMGSKLQLQVAAEVPGRILGYPARLKQLLHQLINTSFDYSDGQAIAVRIEKPAGTELQLRIDLAYSGQNLNEQELALLLERDSLPEDGARHNLRLALARQLADSMDAHFQVCNQPEGGARIAVLLPYQRDENANSQVILPESLMGKRLLVVDSDPDFCQMLQLHTKRWGMHCLIAHNEQQALAIVRNQLLLHSPIESIVVDHQLHTGSASQLLTRIHSELAERGLPPPLCVLLTDEIDNDAPAQRGFYDVLAKHNCAYLLRGVLERAYSPQPT